MASAAVAEADHPVSYRTLRYTGVVGQADWSTCGLAVVTTLLIYYFGIETSEFEILELSEGFMLDPGLEAVFYRGRVIRNPMRAWY